MNTSYLLLGGNLGDKEENLRRALELLEQKAGATTKRSGIFITAAWGNEEQPEFYNQAVELQTKLTARELLKTSLETEELMGRTRSGDKWQERIIDIDILLFNNEVIKQPDLTIPHPFMHERRFVLVPLNEIASEKVHPVFNKTIAELLASCGDKLEVKRKENFE